MTQSPTDWRKRIWGQLSRYEIDGGEGPRKKIDDAFDDWVTVMGENKPFKDNGKRMTGFLLPLADERISTSRVG